MAVICRQVREVATLDLVTPFSHRTKTATTGLHGPRYAVTVTPTTIANALNLILLDPDFQLGLPELRTSFEKNVQLVVFDDRVILM